MGGSSLFDMHFLLLWLYYVQENFVFYVSGASITSVFVFVNVMMFRIIAYVLLP